MKSATARMIRPLLILLLLGGTSLQPLIGQEKSPDIDEALNSMSLKEVTDWLEKALPKYSSRYELSKNTLTKIEEVKFDGCSIKYYETRVSDDPIIKRIRPQIEVSYNLADINPLAVRVQTIGGSPAIVFLSNDRKPAVSIQARGDSQKPRRLDGYYFPFQKTELAQPISKAFTHAVKQCQQQK